MNGKLYRSRSDRMISGVAGGVAQALRIDPSLVRIAWVILIFLTGGFMLLLYVVMAIVVPQEPADGSSSDQAVAGTAPAASPEVGEGPSRFGSNAGVLLGAFLIFIGLWFLADRYLGIDWSRIWPIAIIGLGVLLLAVALRRS